MKWSCKNCGLKKEIFSGLHFYLLAAKGVGKVIDWPASGHLESSQGLLWMHLDTKMPKSPTLAGKQKWTQPDSKGIIFK